MFDDYEGPMPTTWETDMNDIYSEVDTALLRSKYSLELPPLDGYLIVMEI